MENSPSKILIIDTAWLGDVVFTTSLIGAVRETWPGASIHILVAPRGVPIVLHHPHVARVWVYDKHSSQKSLGSLRGLARDLRTERYDLILNAHPSFRSRLLTKLIGARISVGYRGSGSRFCFTHVISNDLAVEPDHVERRINLLRALGVDAKAAPLLVGQDPAAMEWAQEYLREHIADSAPVLGLICGSAWRTKRWANEGYSEIGKRWHRETGGRALIFGGTSERADIENIAQQVGGSAVPMINESLPRVSALLSRCTTVVGNDTGVSFLAIAAGCPKVIVLYGSTQVNYSFPAPHKAITAGVPCCLPRTGHGAHHCRWSDQPWCMGQIGAETVWRAVNSTRR